MAGKNRDRLSKVMYHIEASLLITFMALAFFLGFYLRSKDGAREAGKWEVRK